MEEHLVVLDLQRSRARLRELLLPDPQTGGIEADFPRSAVMRVVMASLPALLPLLTTLVARSRPLRLVAETLGLRMR